MNRILIIASTLLTLNSCQFNQSVDKNLITGAYSRGNGLDCNNISIKINNKIENRTAFIFGEKVVISFNDVVGLKSENGKVYPALMMYIIKNKKDTVLSSQNLLKNLTDGIDLSPLKLEANFIASLPHKNHETYTLHVLIQDNKGQGTFTYDLPFKIEESKLLNITSNGLAYSNIYLWNESTKKPVFDTKVNQTDNLILILEGIDGMEQKNGNVFPILSIDLKDNKANKIISDTNILSQYIAEGIDNEKFTLGQIPVKITFIDGHINNPYSLKAILKDKHSRKKLEISTKLELK